MTISDAPSPAEMVPVDYLLLDYVWNALMEASSFSYWGHPSENRWTFSPPPHNLADNQLADRLLRLLALGLLFSQINGQVLPKPTRSELLDYIRMDIQSRPRFQDCFFIGLTPRGGDLWEGHFSPDWSKYYCGVGFDYDEESDLPIPPSFRLEAREEDFLRYVFEAYLKTRVPKPGTVKWERLEPWHVTYWKDLPYGYRVEFEVLEEHLVLQDPDWHKLESIVWRRYDY